jgi:cytochrome c556
MNPPDPKRGKFKMQALVAVMRKLLHAFHGMFKTHQPYDGSKLFRPVVSPLQEVARAHAAS